MVKQRNYTQEEFNYIVDLINKGESDQKIYRWTGRSVNAIGFIRTMNGFYQKGKDMHRYKGYEKRLKAYYEKRGAREVAPPQANGVHKDIPSAEDNITRLENAFVAFQTELVEIIDTEAKRRSEKEINDLRQKYETELEKMQTILVQAQNSSMVGLLRKRWLGQQ